MNQQTDINLLIEDLNRAQEVINNGHTQQFSPWTQDLVLILSISILVFTFGALLLGVSLLWRHKAKDAQILHVMGVITIIGVSAFLLVVGYSNEQLTPIIGLFGAIAGYLLGKESNQDNKSDDLSLIQKDLEFIKKQCTQKDDQ